MATETMATGHNRAIESLIDQGRRSGRLTTDDLGRALPIETMAPREIAAVVDRLEAGGIEVDVDERLTVGRARIYEAGGSSAGVVDMAEPAAPAVSAPGVAPSEGGWIGSHDPVPTHGTRRSPTWNVDGFDLMPVVAIVAAALVILIIVG